MERPEDRGFKSHRSRGTFLGVFSLVLLPVSGLVGRNFRSMVEACFGKSCLFSFDTESYLLVERLQALGSDSEPKAVSFSDIDSSARRIG